jgi:hypothetical protein
MASHPAATKLGAASAGGGAGITLSQHIAIPKGTPLCNVWLTLLKGSRLDVDSHGDSTGIVTELAGTTA